MEHAPLDERELHDAAAHVYGPGERLAPHALRSLAARYGPWQGYWAHYLRAAHR